MSSTIQMESPWHQNLGRGGDLSRLRLGLIDEKVNETKWAFSVKYSKRIYVSNLEYAFSRDVEGDDERQTLPCKTLHSC
jgi:hypothetical protein